MATLPDNYYNRFDPADNYDEHLFIPGRGLQAAELNEIQRQAAYRTKGVGDAFFRDGAVVRDARCVVNESTGAVTCEAGAIYLRGAVRGVQPATFTIPLGVVTIGIYLVETVVTALEDPDLRDPATGTRNYSERGAERLRVVPMWGFSGDGGTGEFFPVYTARDRVLDAKEAPPNIDAFTQTLARYDRDSTGGSYVSFGLTVVQLDDADNGDQVYSVLNGRARVNGYEVEFLTSRRVTIPNEPDLRHINNEPHLSATASAQRIDISFGPMVTPPVSVNITAEKTASITHGVFTGAQDLLPDTSVVSIVEVKQGGTTYTQGADYQLTANKVDWSLTGAEPAPGSTYTVKYRYLTDVTPTDVDAFGFTVTGAVVGTLILVTYNQMLPRIDRICLNSDGFVVVVKGVASDYLPRIPPVPINMLGLASVYQTWTDGRRVVNDGIRMVSMSTIAGIEGKIDRALQLIAQNRLESNIHTREAGTKKGLFVDPFIDDSQRDLGIVQDGAIFRGILTLPIDVEAKQMGDDIEAPETCAHTTVPALQQLSISGSMKINPYMAFAHIYTPSVLTLTPAVDNWTEVVDLGLRPGVVTEFISDGIMSQGTTLISNNSLMVATGTRDTVINAIDNLSRTENIQNLRQIEVTFSANNFGPGEIVSSLRFDGIDVPVSPI